MLFVLRSQHDRQIKADDYYTYDEAVKRIMKLKEKQKRSKEQAIEVLEFIRATGSIPNALQAIQHVPERFRLSQGWTKL